MNRRSFPALPLVSACLLFAGLGHPAMADGSIVTVTMWDKGANAEMAMDRGIGMAHDAMMTGMMDGMMGMKLSADTVPAGEVTFKVTNTSKDQVHEMLVVPWPADGKGLPYNQADARFDEDAAGSLGEVEELDPGKSGELTLNLKPGKYALACNVANHYADGMWTEFTVK
ncbi:MAG TPA: hypothetical protein VG742_20600 [Dongiaceae bacterium]|nr:hypothetical protein [Dongiaceae bacterium]